MKTYEQDYKTTIRCSFSDQDKVMKETEDFWFGEHTVDHLVKIITRSFNYTTRQRHPESKLWFKFIEGVGEFYLSTEDYETYIHESEEMGTVKIWYECEFEEEFSATEV